VVEPTKLAVETTVTVEVPSPIVTVDVPLKLPAVTAVPVAVEN